MSHKFYPFKGCSCEQCRWGRRKHKSELRNVERRMRRKTRVMLKKGDEDVNKFYGNPYTD